MTFEFPPGVRRFAPLHRASALLTASLFLAAAPALAEDAVIDVVSPPNPHVFPLLIALEENPDLPVRLHPVAGGKDIEAAFDNGGDVLLAMTYIGAKQRASGAVDDLELLLPVTWRGFWEVASGDIESFEDLKGQTVIVSGPAGSGQGGGGDVIFRAAAKRQGVDPDTDLNVIYAPVSEAQAILKSGEAAAIAVPAPASTGFAMQARMTGSGLTKAIDYQAIFSGYSTFPGGQLPLGGIHATEAALSDPEMKRNIAKLVDAYADAVRKLNRNPLRHARIASSAFKKYYAGTGAPTPPASAIAASISNGDLIYRTDIPLSEIERDLDLWLTELLGVSPDDEFYADERFAVASGAVKPARKPKDVMRERMRTRKPL